MRQVQEFETPGETFGRARPIRSGAEPVSTTLSRGPRRVSSSHRRLTASVQLGTFWNLVQDEKSTLGAGAASQEPRGVPLSGDPIRAAQGRLVGAGVVMGQSAPFGDLRDEGRLADLASPSDDLEETARLAQTGVQICGVRPRVSRITQHNE